MDASAQRQPNWEELLRAHEVRGRAFCLRMLGDADWADDVYQEACLRIFQARDRYAQQASFGTYLYRVLSNGCLNALRDRRHVRRVERPETEEPAAAPAHRPAGLDALIADENRASLREALDQLPEPQRVAVILKVCEEQSYTEIGQVLNVSEAHAAVLVYRAKKKLCERLGTQVSEVRP